MPVDVSFESCSGRPSPKPRQAALFRVVGSLPARTAQRRAATTRGQVSHKPRGIKPRRTPPLVFKADLTTTSFADPGIQGGYSVRERHDDLAAIGTHFGKNGPWRRPGSSGMPSAVQTRLRRLVNALMVATDRARRASTIFLLFRRNL